jgi:hypothetical protein
MVVVTSTIRYSWRNVNGAMRRSNFNNGRSRKQKAGPVRIPADFPTTPYASIYSRIAALPPSDTLAEFEDAWRGLEYRFIAFDNACTSFDDDADDRTQDAALYSVFSNGIACVECCCYGLFAVGALIEPDKFHLASPTDKRNATVGATLRLFGEVFHDTELTRALFWWLNSREFGWWKETRAMLAQRVAPRTAEGWQLRGIVIDRQVLGQKRAWLVELLTRMLDDAAVFVEQHASRLQNGWGRV